MTPLQDEEERKKREAAAKEAGKIEREEQEWGPGGQPKASEQIKKAKGNGKGLKGLKNPAKSEAFSKGADIAKTLAGWSGAKKYRDAGVDKGTPVQANDTPPKGMDLSVAYDNKSPLPDDDTDYQKKKKQYGLT